MIMPTMGMAMNEPIPRGAMAMPALQGGIAEQRLQDQRN